MRDLVLIAMLAGVMPFVLLRPWIGILVWLVISISAPHQQTWSLSGQPVGALVAAVLLVGYPLFRDKVRGIPMRAPIVLMLMLWAWTLVTSLLAYYPDVAFEQLGTHSKMLLFVMLALTLFQDRERLAVLFAVLVGSLGLYAVKGALFSLANGAQSIVFGPEGTIFYDNNDFALGLNMVLPLAIFLMRSAESRRVRLAWMGVSGCVLLSVLFTYSRGGLVALAALIGVTVLRSKQRVPAIAAAAFVLVVAILFAPAHWTERMGSIVDYDADASVSGRFNAWHFSWNLAQDNPITGGGFGVFTAEMFARYAPDPDTVFVAHSVYFDLMATHGFVGLALYLAMMAATLLSAERLRKRARDAGDTWVSGAAEAIQLALIAFLVGGAFLSKSWNELAFYLIAGQVLLGRVAATEVATDREPLPLWQPEAESCAA